jgi:hypothetical protein
MSELPEELKNLKGDANKFVDQIYNGVGVVADQLKVNNAIIYNYTDSPVNFYVYNYSDTVYWVSAMHTLVAPEKAGAVAASGVTFKIHPNDNKDQEFLVEPHKAYIYFGPGDVMEIPTKDS